MRYPALLIFLLLQSFWLKGQQNGSLQSPSALPLPFRQVSGIVRDSIGNAVIGATLKLISVRDSVTTTSDKDGIFIFDNIKSATFVLTVSQLGFSPIIRKYLNNDLVRNIVLEPIILGSKSYQLEQVTIKGPPGIIYKTDTVEYRASDYIVRARATVDELLKKMEGMEVGNDGSLSYNGSSVLKARLNGKDIYNGNVTAAIQSLPAEIVDKIQIIDDYGNMATRTGVKDGDSQKMLNITTRTDKSVGNMARLNGGLGTSDQFEGSVNLTRISQNQTVTATGTFSKTPNGISGGSGSIGRLGGSQNRGGRSGSANEAGSNVSGGENTVIRPAISYHDNLGKKIDLTIGYGFNNNLNNTIVKTDLQLFSTLGTSYASQNTQTNAKIKTHNLNMNLEYIIDSANFLQFTPTMAINSSEIGTGSTNFQNGLIHQDQLNRSNISASQPNFSITAAYQHIWFKKPGRILAGEATAGRQKNNNVSEQNSDIKYYQGNSTIILQDSVVQRAIVTDNMQNSFRASITYTEPLNHLSKLEFNSNVERRSYDNSKVTGNLNTGGTTSLIDSLSNIYKYSFTQYRNSLNFRYGNNTSRYNFSFGLTTVSSLLTGSKFSLGTSTNQTYFKVIPIMRFQLRFARTNQISFNYNGRATEPDFNQIQPMRDVSNPQNPIVGNPDLKAAFAHTITASYNNYLANKRVNLIFKLNSAFIENQVSINTIQIKDAYGSLKNETHYLNMNGNSNHSIDYSVAKTLNNRKYSIEFSGNVINNNWVSMSNNVKNTAITWGFKENIGPKINPTDRIEINPYISYDINKTDYSLAQSTDFSQKTWALSLDGNIYFLKNMQLGYAISKNYVKGIGNNLNKNPFIISSMLQANLFNNKASIQFRALDVLNQNNFINRNITASGISETLTNPNSRYFMLNLSMNLQKWTGARERNGRPMIRRGDGSFIY